MTDIQPPLLTIGKNLNGLAVLKDKTTLITKLYPRGSGSPPSELTLDTPPYYPSGQYLSLDHQDESYAYFGLPNKYSAYNNFTGDGQPLPSGFHVGRDTHVAYNLPAKGTTSLAPGPDGISPNSCGFLVTPTGAMAALFYMSGTWTINSVSLQLQRLISSTPTQWAAQPRFIVGLWSVCPSTLVKTGNSTPMQLAGWKVPWQGPQSWCYGNLLSIDSTTPEWYTFPLQPQQHTWTGWVAIVIMPYPTSNKQWSSNDFLAFGGSASREGQSHTSYSLVGVKNAGVSSKNWLCPTPGEPDPWAQQMALQVNVVSTDVTSQFYQSDNTHPGRYVRSPMSAEPSDGWAKHQYLFYYQHAPFIINWDAYDKYGKYEGTFKNDTVTTQTALLASASQYLQQVSEPTMTISLGAVDLYNIDPDKNWAEELYVGGTVRVIDDLTGLDETCIITELEKQDLTQPHTIDTLTLNNIHINAQKLLGQIATTAKKTHAYLTGTTVETPDAMAVSVATTAHGTATFAIRDVTTLTQGVRLSVDAPGTFKLVIDGNVVKENVGQMMMRRQAASRRRQKDDRA